MFVELKVFAEDEELELAPAREEEHVGMDWKALEEAPSSTIQEDQPTEVEGERQRKYEVVQQLLHNLNDHQDLVLRELAIEAAELVLGHRLDRVREKILGQKPKAPPPQKTDGPLFKEEGWIGCKQIGLLAGNYSAENAGRAATLVASRWGFSKEDIRKKQLPFNNLIEAPDTNGRLRPQFRFNRAFSNEVVIELRSNDTFAPKKTPSAEAVLERGGSLPNLSKPLDFFENQEASENMESFLETLEGQRPKH